MIGVLGLSHLGIVTSAAAAAMGFDVIAVDPDAARCAALERGELPILEAGLPELMSSHRGRVTFSADPSRLSACMVLIVAADVPTGPEHRGDCTLIQRLAETAAAHAAPGATLVINSQVPPGFTRKLGHWLQRERPEASLTVCYQVETLVIGQAIERALHPERLIVGSRSPRAPLPAAYAALLGRCGCPILRMHYESAELAKIAVNMLLASSVCTTNTLAELCEAVGADWDEIVPALQTDRRIGPHAYLQPGLGPSGGNLERDLATFLELARRHQTDAGLVQAWLAHSRRQRDWALERLRSHGLLERPDAVIALWGLAYKPGTASLAHAPSLALLAALAGHAVQAYDPSARLEPGRFPCVQPAASAIDACEGADALVILTPWPAFASANLATVLEHMRGRLILDPSGVLKDARAHALGFTYLRLGTGQVPAESAAEPARLPQGSVP